MVLPASGKSSAQLSEDERSNKEQYIKAQNFIALKDIRSGKAKKAKERLTGLVSELQDLYGESFEGKSLVHNVYRNLAMCSSKLGLPQEALGLLKPTLQWQIVCQGNTFNVMLTQTMIQTVSQSSGNTQELEKSKTRVKEMSLEMEPGQVKILQQSAVMVDTETSPNINQSLISINM